MMAGFGAPKPAPKTLEEVVRDFGNRLPKDPAATKCACGSGDSYADCCRPCHVGTALADTPERALRARWTAFAYRLPIYIMDSTDKARGAPSPVRGGLKRVPAASPVRTPRRRTPNT